MNLLTVIDRQLIKSTSSLCPDCRRQIPAEVYESAGKVYLEKTCPEHGHFNVLINSDRRFYYLSQGAGDGSCCGGTSCCGTTPPPLPADAQDHGGHDPALIEKASTCIALIEIVESCNLKCPTCFADSPFSDHQSTKFLSLDEFWNRIGSVLARKNSIDVLQLSGGEPTIHPQFFQLLESVLADKRIGYTLLNTNGVLLARDKHFVDRLGELHRKYRKFETYLQYDGPQQTGQVTLRGADFRPLRADAIRNTAAFDIPTTLAMTVTPDNLHHLGDAVRQGLASNSIRGISFQPMFHSGRVHAEAAPIQRLNVADIILRLVEQSEGLLSTSDFTPLPCGDPNCHTIGYLLRRAGQVIPVSKLIDFSSVQGFLKDRINFSLEDLARCGCETEPLGRILTELEIGPDNVFRIFIKPFMDAWTYDQHRIDRCCVHVVVEGGRLESFCRHYAMKGSS